jgi:hypothetical protein
MIYGAPLNLHGGAFPQMKKEVVTSHMKNTLSTYGFHHTTGKTRARSDLRISQILIPSSY